MRKHLSCMLGAQAAIVAVIASCCTANANVVISNKASSGMTCSAGVCTATTPNAFLNVGDLQTMLASSDVSVRTGAITTNIVVKKPFSWASASSLTLDATQSINVNRSITVSGSGGVTFITNDGGTGGLLLFGAPGNLNFWSTLNPLTIDGVSYALMGTLPDLVSAIAANPSGNFALAKNYDASVDGTYTTSPIATLYNGHFQGLGNVISNFQMNAPRTRNLAFGLFAHLASDGSISNVTLTGINIVGAPARNANLGGLVGLNEGELLGDSVSGTMSAKVDWTAGVLVGDNEGTIRSSHASGQLTGGSTLGGLVGQNGSFPGSPGQIADSDASVSVSGDNAGGLVALSYGTIAGSHATGSVSGASRGGGLVGYMLGSAERCYATGQAQGRSAGGLVGGNRGAISFSFSTGAVIATAWSGGLVGENAPVSPGEHVSVKNSYSIGSVSTASGGSAAGGFIGHDGKLGTLEPQIIATYSTGTASGASSNGGFVGFNEATSIHSYVGSYWNVTTSGTTQGTGSGPAAPVAGLTTQQLQSGLPVGLSPNIWAQSPTINNGFPYLKFNPPPQ